MEVARLELDSIVPEEASTPNHSEDSLFIQLAKVAEARSHLLYL